MCEKICLLYNALKHGLQNEGLNYTITKKKYIKTKYIKQGCFQKLFFENKNYLKYRKIAISYLLHKM